MKFKFDKQFNTVRNYEFYGAVDGVKTKVKVFAGDSYKIEKSAAKGKVILAYQKGSKGKFLIDEKIANSLWHDAFEV